MNPFNEISTQSPLAYYVALYKKPRTRVKD